MLLMMQRSLWPFPSISNLVIWILLSIAQKAVGFFLPDKWLHPSLVSSQWLNLWQQVVRKFVFCQRALADYIIKYTDKKYN